MNTVPWDSMRDLIATKINVPASVVDYISVSEILLLCASGSSNYTISRYTDFDLDYVESVLMENLSFSGWNSDLDFNPTYVFNLCHGVRREFNHEILALNPNVTERDLAVAYLVSMRHSRLSKEMEKYWI